MRLAESPLRQIFFFFLIFSFLSYYMRQDNLSEMKFKVIGFVCVGVLKRGALSALLQAYKNANRRNKERYEDMRKDIWNLEVGFILTWSSSEVKYTYHTVRMDVSWQVSAEIKVITSHKLIINDKTNYFSECKHESNTPDEWPSLDVSHLRWNRGISS